MESKHVSGLDAYAHGLDCASLVTAEDRPCDCIKARAKELYEALKELRAVADEYSEAMREIGRGHMELGPDAPYPSASGKARYALAKAEGESVGQQFADRVYPAQAKKQGRKS